MCASGIRGSDEHCADVERRREQAGRRAEQLIGDERDEADRHVEEVAETEPRLLEEHERREDPRIHGQCKGEDKPPIEDSGRRQRSYRGRSRPGPLPPNEG